MDIINEFLQAVRSNTSEDVKIHFMFNYNKINHQDTTGGGQEDRMLVNLLAIMNKKSVSLHKLWTS